MNATALLLMLALGIDHSGRLVSAREGGGPTEAASQDAQATGSGGAVSETVAPGPVSQPSPGSVAAPPTETATEPLTTVCQCLGFNEAVCHCRKHGQVCHCTRTSGSVWAVNERGQATHKTGAKADPRVGPGQKTAGNVPEDDTVPRKRSDGRYWWKGADGTWFGTATLTEGQVYTSGANRFIYHNGKMEAAPKMAADITPKQSGHWEYRRQCQNGVCRMVPVWVGQ